LARGLQIGPVMDRKIKKKKWPKVLLGFVIATVLISITLYAVFRTTGSTLTIKAEKVKIETVVKGPFQEYIRVVGMVEPKNTTFLDAIEGGRVEEIFLEAGNMVHQGDPILRLSNTNLLLDIMYREAEFFQQSNNLRDTRLLLEQNRLKLNNDMAEVDYRLRQASRLQKRYAALFKDQLVSTQDYQTAQDDYEYMVKKKELTVESMKKELSFREEQIVQLEDSLERMRANLDVVKQKQENLTLKAPVDGHLTSLNAEIGQSKAAGERLGQIDETNGFKVRAMVDQAFLARVEVGKSGNFEHNGEEYDLVVSKIYPEINDGRFDVDFDFKDTVPGDLRRGLSLYIKLEEGIVSEELLLPRGGFYNRTGGNWIYVVDPSEEFAVKRSIRLGLQNPEYFTVVEGLKEGEKVLTSDYENYNEKDRLVLK
jgi:HlyD family secretion protein